MASTSRKSGLRRRIVVVVVPPIDELDLVTNANRLTVGGEGSVLTFMARHHFNKVAGACHSVLLVCGLGTDRCETRRSLRG